MLRERLAVAIVGIPLALLVIWWGGYALIVFVGLLMVMALHEYYQMIRPYRPNALLGYVVAVGLLSSVAALGFPGIACGVALGIVLSALWALRRGPGDHLTGRVAVTLLGVVWISTGMCYLILLRRLDHGVAMLLLAVGATWFNDTFAFFVGKALGKHKLARRISPNKTVEGAVGGLLGAVVFTLGVKIYNPTWFPLREAVILGLVIGLAGQIGDLFESALKRDLQVKDSGTLLSGHGGVLDRVDSLLLAAAATYWGAWLLLRSSVGGFPL